MSSVESAIEKAVASLRKKYENAPPDRYITHIRFPRFKNLVPGARIDFPFPVTALIGPNGCGKTSALHALYGAPEWKSTSDYWFETGVDSIESRADDPQRFVYGHRLRHEKWLPKGGVVETRKARVTKAGRPEYWEPTKATVGDEMASMPDAGDNPEFGKPKERVRSLDRWSAVKRNVLYLNFRGELGAFDQFFWFGNLRSYATHSKQDEIRKKSLVLKRTIEDNAKDVTLWGKRRVFQNSVVDQEVLLETGSILGKAYDSARLIEHNLYGGLRAYSAVFTGKERAYSDAFAGSGEIAVLNLVARVRSQPKGSLILLDEPEVSLHPGAQKRLMLFLLTECQRNQHQVIFTTHSPHLVEDLPAHAIKVFSPVASGHFSVLNDVHPYAAFHRLGATPPGHTKILVEDRLAKHVVQLALGRLDEATRKAFIVDYLPGGSDHYFTHRIPTLMHEKNVWLLLDGDQKKVEFRPPEEVPDAQLDDAIDEFVGPRKISYGADGGTDALSLVQQKRSYLRFLYERVRFLPRSCPEEIVLRAIVPDAEPATSQEAKHALRNELAKLGLNPSSSEQDAQAQLMLAQRQEGNQDLKSIADCIGQMLPTLGGAGSV